jgi:hypothetical protein
VRLLGRKVVILGFVACVEAMTWACGSRATPADAPVPPQAEPTEESPVTPPTAPEPPPATATPGVEIDPLDCALIAAQGTPIATVALTEPIDPSHAPYPSNESERLLFRQLYETLVRVDCNGQVRPGLASSWHLDPSGRTWIVTLRENARFSDGTPVTPTDVRTSWGREGLPDELRAGVRRLVESIVPLDDRTLAITLRSQRVDMPLALAHTDLAIARPLADSPWPLGTRPERTAPAVDTPSAITNSTITLEPDSTVPLRFVVARSDPRDLLDREVDLLLTRDPAAIDYAATLPHFQSVPLAWQRTQVFIAPGRTPTTPPLAEPARQSLAEDAVRGEARGAIGPFWWQLLQHCEIAPFQPRKQASLVPRVVYDASDDTARDLAERLVGLARTSEPAATAILDALLPGRPRLAFQRATGLTGEPLAAARRRGTDAGYIVAVDKHPVAPCRDIQVLTESVRWLDPETIVPLVETRLHAIVRRGRSGIVAEGDGGLLIAGSGPR